MSMSFRGRFRSRCPACAVQVGGWAPTTQRGRTRAHARWGGWAADESVAGESHRIVRGIGITSCREAEEAEYARGERSRCGRHGGWIARDRGVCALSVFAGAREALDFGTSPGQSFACAPAVAIACLVRSPDSPVHVGPRPPALTPNASDHRSLHPHARPYMEETRHIPRLISRSESDARELAHSHNSQLRSQLVTVLLALIPLSSSRPSSPARRPTRRGGPGARRRPPRSRRTRRSRSLSTSRSPAAGGGR